MVNSAESVADPSAAVFEWACCEHCGCQAPEQIGHDDTCLFGCNDPEHSTEPERPNDRY